MLLIPLHRFGIHRRQLSHHPGLPISPTLLSILSSTSPPQKLRKISAQQLRTERPFLLLNIIAITTKSSSRQQRLGALIRQHVAENMIIGSENSIDLLLGLLAFLSWYSYVDDCRTKSSLSVFSQVAISLVFDLGLHKRFSHQFLPVTCKPAFSGREHTIEEQRAALACFLLTSSISRFVQRTYSLRWTQHLAESLDEIAASPDRSAEDELLVFLVRCQLVVEKAAETFEWTDGTPPTIYVQALQARIEDCRRHMPSSTQLKTVASLHLITTEIIIYQMALARCLSASSDNEIERVKYLYSCTKSIKAWFEIYFTIPANQYYGFQFSVTSQIVRCLQLLYYVSTLEDPAWNRSDVRSSMDILDTMDQVISRLSQVSALVSLANSDGSDQNVFTRSAHQFQALHASCAVALNTRPNPTMSITTSEEFGDTDEIGIAEDWEVSWPNGDWWAEFPIPQQY